MNKKFVSAKQRRAVMAKMKAHGVPYVEKTVRVNPHGKVVDWKKDKERKAQHPGRRETEWGTVYYEKRANRSDVNRKINL